MILLFGVAVVVTLGATWIGLAPVSWDEVTGRAAHGIFWKLRVPRVALAAATGATLAVGGALFQILFRNPLATPFTLGISTAASMGAAIGVLGGLRGAWLGVPKLTVVAFLGAAVALGLILLLARTQGTRDMTRLLLGGVCIASVGSAGIVLATYLADAAVTNDIVTWMLGSLVTFQIHTAIQVAICLAFIMGFVLRAHRALDLIAMDDVVAETRGVAVQRVTLLTLLLVGLSTAIIVSHCGPIAFVGLIVPHLMRQIVGGQTLRLVVACIAGGASFLVICDVASRSFSRYEIPIGVFTSIIGAAFFFYLLITVKTGE
ncbi:MAG: FecCD family ABC transporter permease [Phycisphaerae bacterium]